MANPYIHAISSARKWKGIPEDYLDIHLLMDSSKSAFPDNRHRALTHNSWFTQIIIPRVFGDFRTNSDGRIYFPKDVAEFHILEDFKMKFIPSAQDYLEHLAFKSWMHNALGCSIPGSCQNKGVKQASLTFKIQD